MRELKWNSSETSHQSRLTDTEFLLIWRENMLKSSFTLEQWLYGRDDTVAPPPVDARIALAEALVSAARINGGISILACLLTLVLLWGYWSCPSMWCKFGCGQRASFSGGLWCNL